MPIGRKENVVEVVSMKRRSWIASAALALLSEQSKGSVMQAHDALRLVQAWGRNSKDMTFIGRMVVDPRGGFVTRSSGAFFRYLPQTQSLSVSGLVGYNVKLHSEFPETWQEVLRAAARESASLGDGQMELYTQKLMEFEPDVILLTKAFTNPAIDPGQFAMEIRWLLSAANYWFMKRHSEVMSKPEEELIREAPGINARWPKRPW